jgi:hypothetical protein
MVGWRIATSDDGISQMRNRNNHSRYRHPRDGNKMLRVFCLANVSVGRHWSFAAVHLTHRCARRTIRAATFLRRTRHHRRNTDAEWKERSDEKYGEKAHDHHPIRTARHRQSALYLRTCNVERQNRELVMRDQLVGLSLARRTQLPAMTQSATGVREKLRRAKLPAATMRV